MGAVNGPRSPRRAALVLLAIAAGGCAFGARRVPRSVVESIPEYMRVPSRAPALTEAVDSAPEVVWRATLGRGSLGAVAMGERVTAIATVDRWVYLVDTRTGRVLWRLRGDNPYTTGPVVGNGRVYAASGSAEGRLTAIDLYSGKRRFSVAVGDVRAPLTLRDTVVYGATQQGVVFAVKSGNGATMWRRRLSPIAAAPVVTRGWVAVVTLSDSLVVLDAATGRPRVRAALPAGVLGAPALVGDSALVLASPSGGLALVTLDSGVVRWRIETGGPVYGSPVVARDTAFALTNRCTLVAVPLLAPASADTAAIGCVSTAAPLLVRDGVVVATVRGELIHYDRAARRRTWTRKVRGELQQPPSLRNGQIIVAPPVGDVVSFR